MYLPSLPYISVVIPVYNGQRFIREAIQSVIAQTYPAFEITVVDDGSTDQTRTIVSELMSPIPIVYFFQKNRGQGEARNYGVFQSRGNWIAFLDQDDVWHPDKLSVQAESLTSYPHVSFFFSAMDYMDDTGRPVPPPQRGDPLAPLLFSDSPFPYPSTVMLRKDLFEKLGGFHPGLRCYEDTELFCRISRHATCYCIQKPLVRYRFHPEQAHRQNPFLEGHWPLLYECLFRTVQDDPRRRAILRRATADFYAGVGKRYLKNGDYEKARQYLRRSLTFRPWAWKNFRRYAVSFIPGIRAI